VIGRFLEVGCLRFFWSYTPPSVGMKPFPMYLFHSGSSFFPREVLPGVFSRDLGFSYFPMFCLFTKFPHLLPGVPRCQIGQLDRHLIIPEDKTGSVFGLCSYIKFPLDVHRVSIFVNRWALCFTKSPRISDTFSEPVHHRRGERGALNPPATLRRSVPVWRHRISNPVAVALSSRDPLSV